MANVLDYTEDLHWWLALTAVPDIGHNLARQLIDCFGSPEQVFRASFGDLLSVEGIGRSRAEAIRSFNNWNHITSMMSSITRLKVKTITYRQPEYPELLREITDPPVILYVRGQLKPQDRYALAIVGSRQSSPYGTTVAGKLAENLATLGFTVVSGLARGIDTTAHKITIERGGRTVAVLGCGVDTVYPPENLWLMDRIAETGAVISEFPMTTRPIKENFPLRNRIISGVSLGVIVVEATVNSGALITARLAMEQGREVFAVPGNIMSPTTAGVHKLIQQGAKLVHRVEDIVEELAPVIQGYIDASKLTSAPEEKKPIHVPLDNIETKIHAILSHEPMQVDDITRMSDVASHKVLTTLLSLEVKGLVKQAEGKKFYLV